MGKVLIIIFAVLLIIFQYNLWFGQSGIRDLFQLKKDIVKQKKVNEELSERNQKLGDRIRTLKQEQSAIEELAREQLDMIKEGEVYYRFIR